MSAGKHVSLILASASPARLETLRRAGIEPRVRVSGVDESVINETDPAALALALARLKGQAALTACEPPSSDEQTLLVACDSVLDLGGVAFGKPASPAEAVQRWEVMSGSVGILRTGHFLADIASGEAICRVASTAVSFAEVDADEIEAYVATGEPLVVAGAFTIDGLGGAFISRIEGDPHNVVGISLPLLRQMCLELGVCWTDLWSAKS